MKRAEITSDSSPSLKTLGERIKAVRTAWGWSQEEMAETLRVDQASISFWERDKIKPSGSAMVALSALFLYQPGRAGVRHGLCGARPPRPPLAKAEREFPRSVSLPISDADPIVVVDLVDGTSKGKQLSEAMMVLVESVKAGRRVWVVME